MSLSSRYKNKSSLPLTLISIFGLLIFAIIGILSTRDYTGADSPQCRPIWMYPSYAKVAGFDTTHTKFASKYNLFLYREQGKDKIPAEGDANILNGIPVLFIPGNAGSYKQVRSIAAEASNIFHDHQHEDYFKGRNMDFFAAHFNEDFTAFHGRTMLDQAECLNDAIAFILSLYANSTNPPTSVILLGHSMGGVVARVMLTLPNYVEESVKTIITLAAPHAAAPATFDGDIMRIYAATDKFWRAGFSDDKTTISYKRLHDVTLVSITGGLLDTVLPADYTTLEGLVPDTNGFTVYTTGIPGVWTPIDHLAIVWCDQLRKAIASMMLHVVDPLSSSRSYSVAKRMEVFRRNLLSGFEEYASQDFASSPNQEEFSVNLEKELFVISNGSRLMLTPNKVYLMDLTKIPENNMFHFLSSLRPSTSLESKTEPKLMLCQDKHSIDIKNQRIELSSGALDENVLEFNCINLADDVYSVPKTTKSISQSSISSLGGETPPFYGAQIDTNILKKFKYLIYSGGPVAGRDSFTTWGIDDSSNKTIEMDSGIFSLLFGTQVELPGTGSLVQNIKFNSVVSSLLSFRVNFDIKSDKSSFQPFARQWIEDPFETKWHLNLKEEKKISFHGVAPYTPFKSASNPLHLQIWAPFNDKTSKVTIKIDILESLRLWVLRYRLAVVSLPVFIITVTLALQFIQYSRSGYFPTFHEGLSMFVELILPVCAIVSVLSPLASNPTIKRLFYFVDIVAATKPSELNSAHINPYFLGLQEKNLWILGPLFIIIAFSLVTAITVFFKIVANGAVHIHSLYKSKISIHFPFNSDAKEIIETAAKGKNADRRRLIGTVILLGFVMFHIPYQFAYVVCCIVQCVVFLKAAIRSSTPFKEKDNHQYLNFLNFNASLFILMLWIVPVNVPVLVVFFHNMAVKWETPFSSHHNILAILPIILVVGKNVQGHMLPQPRFSSQKKITVFILFYFAFFSLIYGVRHLYWLHYLLNFFCAWIFVLFYEGLQKPL